MNTNVEKVKLTANILFSGIGCQERGFENSGLFDIEVLNTSDINKEAVLSYAAIHCGLTNEMVETYTEYPSRYEMAQHLTDINLGYEPEKDKHFDWFKLAKKKTNDIEKYWLACKLTKNLGDISRIEELPYADFWTCSFPCTDISVAGKMKGLSPDSGTRSSLLWENIKLLKKAKENNTLPKYIMFENVKNLASKKFAEHFNNLIEVLDELGFNSYWSIINGKDCGVPQNRERVFVISIRKDIDTGKYAFPIPFDTGVRLKDILEDTVDEKYYLSDVATKKFKLFSESKGTDIKVAGSLNPDKNVQDRVRVLDAEGVSQGLRATDYKDPVKIISGIDKSVNDTRMIEYANCITSREDRGVSNRKAEDTAVLEQVGQIYGTEREPNPQAGRVYNSECLSPTLDTCSGGNRMPKVVETKLSHAEWKQQMYERFIEDADGEVSGVITNQSQTFGYRPPMKGFSKTLRAEANDTGIVENFRIRKLTPRECYKLMGLTFEDCDKAKDIGVSDTHLYKQAGNGIITDCCKLLAEHLYKAQYDNTYVCRDENFTKPQVD
ncbi:MAG: DNA (cytosine-5-)-methyltransferase [Eubacteriales bacterium]|nr:DNA (cytosine-5-)-methyltransferase [Eubacteriales bacterium]